VKFTLQKVAVLSGATALIVAGAVGTAWAGESEPAGEPAAACEVPADVLDLSSWKLTLPIGEEGSPTEIKQPDLATYKEDTLFAPTDDCAGVRFRSPVNGVTTGNSSYPRSELREMTPDGSDEAEWSTSEGTHTMEVKTTVTHLPNDKQHLVVAQIHGGDDDLTVFRLEGTSLYVTNGDDSNFHLVTDAYELNTPMDLKFVAGEGKVDAYYNGELAVSIEADSSTNYFKAGAYTQANCENSDPCEDSNYGEAVISALKITHE
jgi:alginate lyase